MTSTLKSEHTNRIMQNDAKKACLEPNDISLGRLFDQVLSNPLILKIILKYLANRDLLATSGVSKHWNIFSREILRENKCLAQIGKENTCHAFRDFLAVLSSTADNNIPWSGLYIRTPSYDLRHKCCLTDISENKSSQLLTKFSVQCLSLRINWTRDPNCILILYIRSLMIQCMRGSSLQELRLHVNGFPRTLSQFLSIDPEEGPWLPNVKLLDVIYSLNSDREQDTLYSDFLKELILASPKLQDMNAQIRPSLLTLFLSCKLVPLIKDFHFRPTVSTLGLVKDFAEQGPELEVLRFWMSREDEQVEEIWSSFCQGQISQILSLLLSSSCKGLYKFQTDHLSLIRMTTGLNVLNLEAVQHLHVTYGADIDKAQGCATLQKINWGKYFPNLSEVCFTYDVFSTRPITRYLTETFQKSTEYFPCDTVTKFTLESSIFIRDSRSIHMFKSVFPNVREFHFEESFYVNVLTELWSAWPDLEEIVVGLRAPYFRNYDAIFLGVREEEVEYLLGQKLDFGSLEIVPMKPCLRNLTQLRKLRIAFSPHSRTSCEEMRLKNRNSEGISLSPLTGHCAFSRLPELEVEIERNLCSVDCQFALHELEPFVNFKN